MTYDEILQAMLDMAPEDVDKREGSVIFYAVSAIAAQLAEMQVYADSIMDATMPDTAAGADLTRKCAEHGINRYPATSTVRLGVFTDSGGQLIDVPIGSRFGADDLAYIVTVKISAGHFKLQCEQKGITGNRYFGAVLPLDNLSLGTAALSDILTPGEDEETDDELRSRYYAAVNAQPFGGNVAQYEEELLKIKGVGGVKVFPTPNNEAGRVHCVVVAPENKPVSSSFLEELKNALDPEPKGKGYGLAPIDHFVTLSTVEVHSVNIAARLYLRQDYSINTVTPDIRQAVDGYLAELAFADNIVRLARIEAAILGVDGVADIFGTTLNGGSENITLAAGYDRYEVPELGGLQMAEEA